jgi:HD-like signal output (HDOD) protein
MKMPAIDQSRVIDASKSLPVFPPVIGRILDTLDDPDANIAILAAHIEHDPIVSSRVLSLANRASSSLRGGSLIEDVFTATSLIGTSRVRNIAIMLCLSNYLSGIKSSDALQAVWEQSIAVGACSLELANSTPVQAGVDAALIAGLLHNVGVLWLHHVEPTALLDVMKQATATGEDWCNTMVQRWGLDHRQIGAWLTSHWELPPSIVQAVHQQHLQSSNITVAPLAAVVHVAEVLSNALALAPHANHTVRSLSPACCTALGLDWGDQSHALFGRIEARNRQSFALLQAA